MELCVLRPNTSCLGIQLNKCLYAINIEGVTKSVIGTTQRCAEGRQFFVLIPKANLECIVLFGREIKHIKLPAMSWIDWCKPGRQVYNISENTKSVLYH